MAPRFILLHVNITPSIPPISHHVKSVAKKQLDDYFLLHHKLRYCMMNGNRIWLFVFLGPDCFLIWYTPYVTVNVIIHSEEIQYIPRNMHTVFALLCFVVVIHWLIFPYPSGLLHWHCGNLTIAPVPAKQPWWIWINTSREFIMHNHSKAKHNKSVCIFLGIYCML